MISVCAKLAEPGSSIQTWVRKGSSISTPFGTYRKKPPLQRSMQGSILVTLYWYTIGHVMQPNQIWVVTHGCLQIGQDHSLFLQILGQLDMHNRSVALHYQAGALVHQGLFQRLGNWRGKRSVTVRRHVGLERLELEI